MATKSDNEDGFIVSTIRSISNKSLNDELIVGFGSLDIEVTPKNLGSTLALVEEVGFWDFFFGIGRWHFFAKFERHAHIR